MHSLPSLEARRLLILVRIEAVSIGLLLCAPNLRAEDSAGSPPQPTLESEMRAAAASHPEDAQKRLEEIRKVNDKWAAKYGRLKQVQDARKRTEELGQKYHGGSGAILAWSANHKSGYIDTNAWKASFEDKGGGRVAVVFYLDASVYGDMKPTSVAASLIGGDEPLSKYPDRAVKTLLPLMISEANNGAYRAEFVLQPKDRTPLRLELTGVLDSDWQAISDIVLPQ